MTQRVTGVQRYAREIIKRIDLLSEPGEFEIAVPFDIKELPEYKNIKITKVGHMKQMLWEQISFPLYAWRNKKTPINLCNVAPLVSPGIVCIFDVKIKQFPQFFSRKFLLWYNLQFKNSTKRAKLILTDSESAKKDILNYYPDLNEAKIVVIPCAWQHFLSIGYDANALQKYNLESNGYYFAMSSLEPNKNVKWIAEAAKQMPEELFAIAGSLNEKIFSEGLGFECPQNIKFLGYVSDEEAKTLMKECKAFLFPSFCEGFGIPPLEALSADAKRIIVSDIPVMHEIFENNAVYVNPNQYDGDLEAKMEAISWNSERILKKYSWDNSAEKLYSLLKKFETYEKA